MSSCTFGDLLNRMLEARIGLGGDVREVVELVHAYEGTNRAARGVLFQEWIETERLCERCRMEFSARHDHVDEDTEAMCIWCRPGYLGKTELYPGFSRAFVRL